MSRLALIAGRGGLPRVLANALAGQDWFACHLKGFDPEGVGQSRAFRLEQLGSFIAELRADGVDRACFAGSVSRPKIDPAAIDAATQPLVPRISAALGSGDDTALRTILGIFEEAGIAIVAPQEVAPSLLDLPMQGTPSDRDLTDIARAAEVHEGLAALDIGQGCVVASGQVLAVEALPGTDWMLSSLSRRPPAPPRPSGGFDIFGGAADWLSGGGGQAGLPAFDRPEGGVFFKAPKAGQDRRTDLPTIGPETVRHCAAAGLNGIAVEAGGVLVMDREAVDAQLRGAGLFLAAWTR